jgi:2-isopropylmalate synthase
VDRLGREVTGAELREMFWKEYVVRPKPWALEAFEVEGKPGAIRCRTTVTCDGQRYDLAGEGNGPIAAFVHALGQSDAPTFEITHYSEHALGAGSDAQAIAYIQVKTVDGRTAFGAGVDTSIELASINAILSALNRLS